MLLISRLIDLFQAIYEVDWHFKNVRIHSTRRNENFLIIVSKKINRKYTRISWKNKNYYWKWQIPYRIIL